MTRAEAYVETERHIRERRERGLFADMRFTMAQPELSCHPETLLAGARSVVSAALCYWAPEPPLEAGEGRLARYTWIDALRASCASSSTRSAERLGGSYRVLVDANQHVDREAASRSGVGFYGKNTMLITQRHGSWVVLGTLVTDVDARADAAARHRLRRLPPLHRCVPDRRARRAGRARRDQVPLVLDAGAGGDPRGATARALGAQVYGCDICQDVCPWNRGVEKRRGDAARRRAGQSTSSPGSRPTADALVDEYDRLYVPRNDPRWLRRNALVALGNTGGRRARRRARDATRPTTTSCSPSTHAWALESHRGQVT